MKHFYHPNRILILEDVDMENLQDYTNSIIEKSKSGILGKQALVLGGGGPVDLAWQSGLASKLVAEGVMLIQQI